MSTSRPYATRSSRGHRPRVPPTTITAYGLHYNVPDRVGSFAIKHHILPNIGRIVVAHTSVALPIKDP